MPNFTLDLADNERQFFDYDGGTRVVYMGRGNPASKTSDSTWQIRKFTYVSSRVTQTNFANGSSEFAFVWDNRTEFDYDPDA